MLRKSFPALIRRRYFSSQQLKKSSSFLPPLLSPAKSFELSRTLPSDDIVFVDASWHLNKDRNEKRFEEYRSNRIPGSVFFDIDEICDKSSPLPHMLPSQEVFSQKMGELGITNSTLVIVYTTADSFSAPRVWWTLRVFKHSLVCILDGGLEGWVKAGYPTVSGITEQRRATSYNVNGFNTRLVASLEEVRSTVQTGHSQICDVRPPERFKGIAPEPRPGVAGGHIPGSLNIPVRSFLQENDVTKFKSPNEIDDIFQQHGVIRNARVIFSCGSGVTASVASFARSLTGVNETMSPVYDGSWSEWGSRSDTPKISPPTK